MMATIWLKNVANQAVSPSLAFIISQMETPECWDLTRVAIHGLKKRPHEHEE